MADLVFDILARDRASRVLKNVGDSADTLAGKLQKLDGLKSGILAAGLPGLAGITGLALSSGAALGSLAVMGTTAKLALSGVGDAFTASAEDAEKYQEALDGLSPAAQSVVVEMTELRGAWSAVGDAVQEAAFEPVVGQLSELSESVIPALKSDLPAVATAMGEAAASGMKWAGSAQTIADVRDIIQGTVPVVRDLGSSLVNVGDFFVTLGAAGMPVVQTISQNLEGMTASLRGWANEAQATGQLDAIFASTSTTVDLLFQNVENLGSAIESLAANPAAINALNDFLEVATSLTGGIAALADAFASLPPGLQEFILVGAGAAVAGSKLYGMYENLTSRAKSAADAQEKVSGSTSKFANVANTMSAAGGRLVAVLGGMQIASALYASTQSETGVSTNQLQNSLVEFGKTGEVTGEMLTVFKGKTDNLKDAFKSLDKDGFAGFGNGLATVIETVTGTGSVFDSSMENHKKRIGELDTALAQMVQSGNAEGARQIIEKLGEDAAKYGVQSDELNAALPQTNALLGDLAAAGNQATQAQQILSAQTQLLNSDFNTAITSVGGLKNAFELLNGGTQTVNTSFAAYQQALDQMTASNVNAKAGFDLTTEAGRQNYAMLQTAVTAMQQYATAANLTGPEIEALRQDIINQGVAAGISRDQMVQMTNSIGAIPGQAQPAANSVQELEAQIAALKSKQVEVKESGSADSKSRVAALQRQIDALKSKVVNLTTNHYDNYFITKNTAVTTTSSGEQAKHGFRWGGIQMTAAASGLAATVAPPGTLYQWAEPETGGEAFIPRRGNMGRSRSIAKYVVDEWLGGPSAVWGGQPTTGGSGGARPDMTAALLREVRKLGDRIENMGINLDGQQIGRAQGRRTLLEQYGG